MGSSQPNRHVFKPWGPVGHEADNVYIVGSNQVVTNGIKTDPRPQCEGLFDSLGGVCIFGLASESHGTS